MGTAKFLVYMTVVIVVWFGWNTLAPADLRFDPYTFTFLTLCCRCRPRTRRR